MRKYFDFTHKSLNTKLMAKERNYLVNINRE